MKQILALVFLLSFAFGQVTVKNNDNFVPKTLFAGTEMSERTASTSMDDTTRAFSARGYAACYVGLESSTNDSLKVYVAYQISSDGSTYNAFTLLDSLSQTTPVGGDNYIALPAKCLGAYDVRVRVYGIAANGIVSLNPAPKVTTRIVRTLISSQRVN